MEITLKELMDDIQNQQLYRHAPVTGWSINSDQLEPRTEVGINYTYVDAMCLISVINFYLKKKMKNETQQGEVVVTTNEDGECVLVSRQDEDHNILKVIWEKK